MRTYLALKKNIFSVDDFSVMPIRFEDRFKIMKWRNEQIYHLRQDELLTIKNQEKYFTEVIPRLFELKQPDQLLFSFLKNDICIGYGGLVRINWLDKNAEISFIMNTELEKNKFDKFWRIFLMLIEEIAFKEINLHKIYTYAFDLRPNLYAVLTNSGYIEEARLKEHCLFQNNYIDILIHSKTNDRI